MTQRPRQQSLTLYVYPSDPDSTASYIYSSEGGTITFDESWSPYMQANLTLMLPMKPFTPAPTAVGSPVPNLITNYTFASGTTGWTAGYDGGTATVSFTGGTDPDGTPDSGAGASVTITALTGTVTDLWMQTTVPTTAGTVYSIVTPAYSGQAGGPDGNDWSATAYVNGTAHGFDSSFTATSTTTTIKFQLTPGVPFIVGDFFTVFGGFGVYQCDVDNPSEGQDTQGLTWYWDATTSNYASAQLYSQANPNLLDQLVDTDALTVLDPRQKATANLMVVMYSYEEDGDLDQAYLNASNLSIETYAVNNVAGTVQILLTTSEYELQKNGNITTSPISYRANQSSLIATVNQVLTDAGTAGVLDSSSTDADVTTTYALQNLITDPRTQTAGSFPAAVGTATFTAATASAPRPSGFYGTATWAAATATPGLWVLGNASSANFSSVAVGGLQTVYLSAYLDPTTAGTHGFRIYQFNAQGVNTAVTDAITGAMPTGAWTQLSGTFQTLASTAAICVELRAGFSAPAGYKMNYSSLMAVVSPYGAFETDGVTPLAFFTGATAASTYYTYSWTGAANASASQRTLKITRDPDSLTLSPGKSYWSMLQPVIQAAGMRLFQDENMNWYLVNASTYTQAGTVTVNPNNTTAMTDSIDLNDTSDVYNSVVITYTWVNNSGNTETAYDAAGTEGPILNIQKQNTPYPGPGAAAARLALGASSGHVIAASVVSDITARPNMAASITAPNTPALTGVVSSIVLDLSSAEMAVTSRGLVEAS